MSGEGKRGRLLFPASGSKDGEEIYRPRLIGSRRKRTKLLLAVTGNSVEILIAGWILRIPGSDSVNPYNR